MFDVTTFLMRWMFLSNILRNVAEIQTFPQQHHTIRHQHQHQHHPETSTSTLPPALEALRREDHWRNCCLQTIFSYPPGGQRLLMVDAYRIELVHELDEMMTRVHECLKKRHHHHHHNVKKQKEAEGEILVKRTRIGVLGGASSLTSEPLSPIGLVLEEGGGGEEEEEEESDPDSSSTSSENSDNHLGTLYGPHRQGHSATRASSSSSSEQSLPQAENTPEEQQQQQPTLPFGSDGLMTVPDITLSMARERLKQLRENLPQLVSAVLKSPPAVDHTFVDPIHAFRRILLKRCAQDPSWGIELCWLLEADVGRAWKALLEHPQQTGRRLVVILPSVEKAALLAKIGHEKSDAFHLLQDAELATAYGPSPLDTHQTFPGDHLQQQPEPPLPSSLSQRRCAHFGDAMHFVDRLTKLSLELRRVPILDRFAKLQEGLKEMNRRIRRRMITKGELSLDVEDSYGPEDWPRVEDLKTDMLQHSVHLPLIPQTATWPTGEDDYEPFQDNLQVVRVLNIVVDESRLLSSRERCPILVQLEVADTGMEGHDARLYTMGATNNVGSAVQEALFTNGCFMDASNPVVQQQQEHSHHSQDHDHTRPVGYSIPPELLASYHAPLTSQTFRLHHFSLVGGDLPRGGSISSSENAAHPSHADDLNREYDPREQQQQQYPYQEQQQQHHEPPSYQEQIAYQDEYSFPDAYHAARQHEMELLHHQMHIQQQQHQQQQQPVATMQPNAEEQPVMAQSSPEPILSTGQDLLNQVFGVPWATRCRQIKEESPFGKVDGWRLASFIMKAGEDIRKEALVMQIISKMRSWFEEEIPLAYRPAMRPYTIMCVGGDAGLVECLSDAKSVDEVKKKTDNFASLRDFFVRAFGSPGSEPSDPHQITFEQAQDNFLRSLVGYSLVCYVLQVKDRHNANILMDRQGHVMHIDFGFVLGETPKMGKVPIFSESAPFKLSDEYWEVLGGWNTRAGGLGVRFCKVFDKAFACASNHAEEIATLVESTLLGLNYDPRAARIMANGVRSRLRMRGPPGSVQQQRFIVELVEAARVSWNTPLYDWLQKNMNGYQ